MKIHRALFFTVVGLAAHETASGHSIRPNDTNRPGQLSEIAVHEFRAGESLAGQDFVTANGHNYQFVGFVLNRKTEVKFGHETVQFEAEAILYDVDKSMAEYREKKKKARPGQLVGVKYSPEYIKLNVTIDDPQAVPENPCDVGRGCQQFVIQVEEWNEPSTAAKIQRIYKSRDLRIKVIDYDWATGTWSRVAIAETIYTEEVPFNEPNGSRTVGN